MPRTAKSQRPITPLWPALWLCALALSLGGCASRKGPAAPAETPLDGAWALRKIRCDAGELSPAGTDARTRLRDGRYRALLHFRRDQQMLWVNSYGLSDADRCEGSVQATVKYTRPGVVRIQDPRARFEPHGTFGGVDCPGDSFLARMRVEHEYFTDGKQLRLWLHDSQPFPQLALDFCASGRAELDFERVL